MSYVYERRYNNFKYDKNNNKLNQNNKLNRELFNPYQPKTASIKNQHSYYSTLTSLKKGSSPFQKKLYNKPNFNYGNTIKSKYNSVRKNGNDPLISNSYNIINNLNINNSSRSNQANLTIYNKRFSIKKENISSILNYENKKKEKEKFYFANKKIKKMYNNDYKQNDNNPQTINYLYSKPYNQFSTIKPTTAPINPLIENNNINSVIKSLESDAKKNDNIIKTNNISIIKSKITPDNNIGNNPKDINKEIINKKEEKMSNIDLTEYYEDNNLSLVLNYSYKEDSNPKYRDYMEDKGRAIENLNGDENNMLFCLFDGHGGGEVSTYLQNNFASHMKNNFPFIPDEKLYFFTELFKNIDKKLKSLNYFEVGSTAVIVYITKEKNKKYIYCVNIGDSRCILIKQNEWKRLSCDDRASEQNEYNRIVKEGGIVMDGRVNGQLMLSRAFGDWELKGYGVSNEPHVTKVEIKDEDLFIVMASDGVWDVLDESEVYKMSLLAIKSNDLCKNIMKTSIEKGSIDNISCFVIQLN